MEHPVPDPAGFVRATDILSRPRLERILEIKRSILNRVKPSSEDIARVTVTTERIISKLHEAMRGAGIPVAFIEPQGSTGIKQTQLAGDSDVDVFIVLDASVLDGSGFSRMQKKEARDWLKRKIDGWIKAIIVPLAENVLNAKEILVSYAEHPYLTMHVDDIKFDVVFCFNLTSEDIEASDIVTAMDRTPLHSKFVRDNLSLSQKDDVRLLKAFFKANHVYGDRSAPGQMGFIGYGLEILVYVFGTMEDVLVNIEALEANAIDVFGRPTRQLRAKVRFSNDFTIIIDPADRNRNVGSSLDERCFRYAANMIKMFISEPDEVFFEQQPIPSPPSSDPHLFSAWFENKAGLHYTIVRDKLYRLGNMAKRALESEPSHEPKFGRIEFAILLDRNDNSAIAFHVEHPTIPATFKHLGPSTKGDPNAVRNFLKKHPRAAANHDGYYYTLVARDVTTFPVALESLITENLDMLKLRPCTTAPGTGIDITSEPGDTLRRQVIHVLASMVLPHMRHD